MPSAANKTAMNSKANRPRLAGNVFENVQIPTDGSFLLNGSFGRSRKTIANKQFRSLIFVHGFAGERTENGLFLDAAHRAVQLGYSVLMYDWRRAKVHGHELWNADLETHVSDFHNAVRWLNKKTRTSPSSVCAVGFSLGAAVVAMAVREGLRLGAAAFWSPAVRPKTTMWPRYEALTHQLTSHGFISKPENDVRLGREILDSLRTTDLGTSAFNLDIPLLVCHGREDNRIPITSTREVYLASQPTAPLRYVEFVGASHSFRPGNVSRKGLTNLLFRWLEASNVKSQPGVYYPVTSRLRRLEPSVSSLRPPKLAPSSTSTHTSRAR